MKFQIRSRKLGQTFNLNGYNTESIDANKNIGRLKKIKSQIINDFK